MYLRERIQLLICFLVFAVILACSGCQKNIEKESVVGKSIDSGEWVVEMYICGSDLEHMYGAASKDIKELLQEKPPDNVKFVIEVGGTKKWKNSTFNEKKIGRYLYDKNGFRELESIRDSDMGQSKTLAEFLEFSKKKFTSDHRVLIIWDHGGGTTGGACKDERTGNIISLNGLHGALATVYDANVDRPPYEVIGFDACLMATLSVANAFTGFGHYLVASQEVEPSSGWNYTGIVKGFQKGIGNDGKALGKVICDTYMQGCKECGMDETATLSVIDLTRMPHLMAVYAKLGQEALVESSRAPKKFFSRYARQARITRNYGSNSRENGYTNMIDLGGFTASTKGLLPQNSADVLSALDAAVVYKVNGSNYKVAPPCGISCYYPYTEQDILAPQEKMMQRFNDVDVASPQHRALYTFLHTGKMPKALPANIMGFFGNGKEQVPKKLPDESIGSTVSFDISTLANRPLQLEQKGSIRCQIPVNVLDNVAEIHCALMYVNTEKHFVWAMGTDSDIKIDWSKGLLNDNFNGTWPMFNGHPIYLRLTHVGDGFNLYSVPIKLNGKKMYMQVYYNSNQKSYKILGAFEGINSDGLSCREFVKLKEGDTVTTLQYQADIPLTGEPYLVDVATFKLGKNFSIADTKLDNGQYYYFFEFVDPQGKTAKSDFASIRINGKNVSIKPYGSNSPQG